MKLNAFTDVCLRVLMTLGRETKRRLTTQEIADHIAVPYNHVAKAVGELRRRGLIAVARGRAGGAVITDEGLEQRVGTLVHGLSGRPEVVDCEGRESGVPCPLLGACALRGALARARDAFVAELDLFTIRDLLRTPEAGRTLLGMPALAGAPGPTGPGEHRTGSTALPAGDTR